MATIKEKK